MTRNQQIAHIRGLGLTEDAAEIILAQMPDLGTGYIPFNGQNCDEFESGCLGWNGVDRRCSCGNRRVYWVIEGGWAYGEAD